MENSFVASGRGMRLGAASFGSTGIVRTPIRGAPAVRTSIRDPPAARVANINSTETSVQQAAVGLAHRALGIGRNVLDEVDQNVGAGQSKRPRKERGPNWSAQEVHALVSAKREVFLRELNIVDAQHMMTSDMTKWQRISAIVMRAACSPCFRDGSACKSKWNQMIPEYKHVVDFQTRSEPSGATFWDLPMSDRRREGLPRCFPQDLYNQIHEWYGDQPTITPPHRRDLLSTGDCVYDTPPNSSDGIDNDDEPMQDFMAGPEQFDTPMESEEGTESTQSPLTHAGGQNARLLVDQDNPGSATAHTPMSRKALPPGVIPYVISSSNTSKSSDRRQPGSTGQWRKSLSGHSLIVEATRTSGNAMAEQMKESAGASRQLEASKINQQLELFKEHMEYQRDRDRRLQDHARLTNVNAKLAIQKQGELVQCLATLSTILSTGLNVPLGTSARHEHVVPTAPTPASSAAAMEDANYKTTAAATVDELHASSTPTLL